MENAVFLSIGRHGRCSYSGSLAITPASMINAYLSAMDISKKGGPVEILLSSDVERAIATAYIRSKVWNCDTCEREDLGEAGPEKFKEFLLGMCLEAGRLGIKHMHVVTHDFHIEPFLGIKLDEDAYVIIKGKDWNEIHDSLESKTAKFEVSCVDVHKYELKASFFAQIGISEGMDNQAAMDKVVEYFQDNKNNPDSS